jgi:hypothetical protein
MSTRWNYSDIILPGKCYGKFRLSSLVERATFRATDAYNARRGLPHQQFIVNDPRWDDPVMNDVMLNAWHDEYQLRANQLNDVTTVPFHATVMNRNDGRNLLNGEHRLVLETEC